MMKLLRLAQFQVAATSFLALLSVVGMALYGLPFYSSPLVLYSFAILFGVGLGGDYMIIPLMAAELFGIKALGRLMGIILTADGVAEALVPMIIGKIRDASTSYSMGFVVLICLAITGALTVSLLPRQRLEAISEFTSSRKQRVIGSRA